jgi:hypothetical protein
MTSWQLAARAAQSALLERLVERIDGEPVAPVPLRWLYWKPRRQHFNLQFRSDQYHGYYTAKQLAESWTVVWQKIGSLEEQHQKEQRPLAQKDKTHLREIFVVMERLLEKELPGDIEQSILSETEHRQMFDSEPALWLLSLHGKYGPWKRCLFQAWQAGGAGVAGGVRRAGGAGEAGDIPQRAACILQVLHRAVLLMAAVSREERQAWTTHCGRNVAHHSGYLALLQDLKVVSQKQHWPAAQKIDLSASQLPQLRKPYFLVPLDVAGGAGGAGGAGEGTLELLARYVQVADLFHSGLQTAPTTCLQYVEKFSSLKQQVVALECPHLKGGYRLPWTFRAACLVRMRLQGVASLDPKPDVSMSTFRQAFPDQNEWVDQLAAGDPTVGDFMAALPYTGPPELLTMKLCLHLDKEVLRYRPEWLLSQETALASAIRGQKVVLGLAPHPSALLPAQRSYWERVRLEWTPAAGIPILSPEQLASLDPAPGDARSPGSTVPAWSPGAAGAGGAGGAGEPSPGHGAADSAAGDGASGSPAAASLPSEKLHKVTHRLRRKTPWPAPGPATPQPKEEASGEEGPGSPLKKLRRQRCPMTGCWRTPTDISSNGSPIWSVPDPSARRSWPAGKLRPAPTGPVAER